MAISISQVPVISTKVDGSATPEPSIPISQSWPPVATGSPVGRPVASAAARVTSPTRAPASARGGNSEAGTPAIAEVLGLHAAIDYVAGIALDAIRTHEAALVGELRAVLRQRNDITLFGPEDSAGIVSFSMDGVHPHDLGTILDEEGVAIRAGHHCAQPLMEYLGVPATARASFGLYSDESDIAALLRGIERTRRIFG